MSHDTYEPKLRVKASGFGGSGYIIPTRNGITGEQSKYLNRYGKYVVPGATTVTGALDKSGVVQWAVDNTAAYAAANIEALANRTEEQAYGFLRWYPKRMKESDFDDPTVDIRDYSNGVLDDLAQLGTMGHDWIADFVNDRMPEDLVRPEMVQMANSFVDWWQDHDVQPVVSEITVLGEGAAGTLDHIWWIDGKLTLLDVKTSRKIGESHLAQLAFLGSADTWMREVGPGEGVEYTTEKWGTTYWKEDVLPPFTQYAILQVRPDDDRYEAKPSFCELHVIDQDEIDAAFVIFQGALQARHGQNRLKQVQKRKEQK